MITKEKIIEILHSHSYNVEDQSGDRQLIVDTYYDREFAEYIEKCTRDYFGIPK